MTQELHEIHFDDLELGQHLQITRELDGKTKIAGFIVDEPRTFWPNGTFTDTGIDEVLIAKLGGSVEVGKKELPMHSDHMSE